MGKIIGIDLGTTNSVVAVVEANEPGVINNSQGDRVTPSVVGFVADGERLVGQLAKRQAIQNPTNTVFSIKRFMGRRVNEVESEEKMVPYEVVGSGKDLVKVNINGKKYTPPEISAMVLRSLKETAEAYLGEDIEEAVITVPAYFNDSQRQATKDAGKIAGLTVKRIINEPTAAALAYGQGKKEDTIIAVFDFGGGTFDISILELSDIDGEQVFEVKATNGDTHLGGDDLDETLINYVADQFQKDNGIDLRKDQMALQRLKEACEKAKCELSSTPSTPINLPFITQDSEKNALHLNMNITRAKFEELCDSIFDRLREPCLTCLRDAGVKSEDIGDVILVGGSTRIPKVQEIVQEVFGREPSKSVNPDEVVALGAAVQGHIISNPGKTSITFLDVTPLSLGVEVEGGLFVKLIDKNTTIPTQRNEEFTTASDQQPAVDIYVYQGERPMAKDNRLLGNFKLDGIPPAPRGIPRIEVAFDIDVNGILNVSAKDKGTGKEQKITIESSSGLTEKQIDKMCKEAEEYADEDAERKVKVETINKAEQLVYGAKKVIKEHKDKIDDDDVTNIEEAIGSLQKAIEAEDLDEIKKCQEDLENIQSEVFTKLYENQTPPTPEPTEVENDAEESEEEENEEGEDE